MQLVGKSSYNNIVNSMKIFVSLIVVLLSSYAGADEADVYWKNWHIESERVTTCSSVDDVSLFLLKAVQNRKNAERSQANAEVIEQLILDDPSCFLVSMDAIEAEVCGQVVAGFVSSPLYSKAESLRKSLVSAIDTKTGCEAVNKLLQPTTKAAAE